MVCIVGGMNQLAPSPPPSPGALVPALVAAAGDHARIRFLEFFAAAIRNPHTRRAYSRAAGLRDDAKRPLFPSLARMPGRPLTRTAMRQADAHAMIRRRASAAGVATAIGNHSFRATGITAYLKNGGTLEKAAAMANHSSTRTTQLYDRRRDEMSLDEVERILV
jgi:integrase